MTDNERNELERAVRLLDNWLYCGKVDKPRQALLDVMQTAINAMHEEQNRSGVSYSRPCAVLQYHVNRPLAELFRDPVTIGAIKTAIAVMERLLDKPQ